MDKTYPFFSFRLLSLLTLMLMTGTFITACSKTGNEKLTSANLDLVTIGMKKAEVKTILGEPNKVETGQFTLLEKTTYYYEYHRSKATVTFLNDAVISKEGSFN